MLIITARQHHLRKFLLPPRTVYNRLTSIVRRWLRAMSCSSKCCCEVLIIRNGKIWASKRPVTPLQFPFTDLNDLSSIHLRLSVTILNTKDPWRCEETQVNCLGNLRTLAPTSLHSSWQDCFHEATHDRTKAHPGRGPSPGSNPLMEILKGKNPQTVLWFLSRNAEISQALPFTIPTSASRRLRGWYLDDAWFPF